MWKKHKLLIKTQQQAIQKISVLLVALLLLIIFPQKQICAQRGFEIGGNLGASYYMGDMNLNKHFYSPHINAGAFIKYHFNGRNVMKVGALGTKLSANDMDFDNKYQQMRNHSFETSLFEISAAYEVHFLPYVIGSRSKRSFTPYASLGLALYFANSAEDKVSVAIPIGIGIKKNILPRLVLGVEWSFRKTFSDKLDSLTGEDISIYNTNNGVPADIYNSIKQTGFKFNKDWYSIACLTLSYTFKLGGIACNAYYD